MHFLIIMRAANPTIAFRRFLIFFTCKKTPTLFICLNIMVLQLITANRNAPFLHCSKQSFSILEDPLNYCFPSSLREKLPFHSVVPVPFMLDSKCSADASAQGKCWGSKAEQTINYCCKLILQALRKKARFVL